MIAKVGGGPKPTGDPAPPAIGTTVTYKRLAQHDLQKAVAVFDPEHGNNGTQPVPHGTETKRG